LKLGGFDLAKWATNHPSLLANKGLEKALTFNSSASVKKIGMRWNPQNDVFHYHLEDSFDFLPPTKRNILSVTSRLFDPLGIFFPLITRAKILQQELWRQIKLGRVGSNECVYQLE